MKFNLIVDIPDEVLEQASHDLEMPMEELLGKVSNTCYLGLDCINAMLHRQYELEAGDWYVSSKGNFGDAYPIDKELPIEVIEHHAQAHDLIASDDLLMFARALWTEGKLS